MKKPERVVFAFIIDDVVFESTTPFALYETEPPQTNGVYTAEVKLPPAPEQRAERARQNAKTSRALARDPRSRKWSCR